MERKSFIVKILQPYHKETYSCVQDMVYTISKFYECDYQMLLLESWGFKYDNRKKKLSECLKFAWEGDLSRREYLLSKYHDILFKYKHEQSYMKNIFNYIDEIRLGVYWDTFDCAWLPSYRKTHGGHFCIVTDYDDDYIYCIDQFSRHCNDIVIPINHLACNDGFVVIEKKAHQCECKSDKYIEELSKAANDFKDKGCLEQCRMFALDMQKEDMLYDELFANDDPNSSKFLLQLKYIANDKLNFIEVLDYIEERTALRLDESKSILYDLNRQYNRLRMMIVKCIITGHISSMCSLHEVCKHIVEGEERVLNSVVQTVKKF